MWAPREPHGSRRIREADTGERLLQLWAGLGPARARRRRGRPRVGNRQGPCPRVAAPHCGLLTGACWCLGVAVICVSLETYSVEPLPMCLAAIWVSSLVRDRLRPSARS